MKHFESFALDTANECLWQDGAQITLPPKPFAVLRYLVENPNRLVTHDELLDALWPETYVQPQVLRTYMLDLRKTLGDDAGQPRFIQTLPKRGYRFVAPVVETAIGTASPGRRKEDRPAAETAPSAPQPTPTAQPSAQPITPEAVSIVGREEDLARLQSQLDQLGQLDQLSTAQRRIVFVTGEAGIGKTTLLDAFSQQAASQSATIARGQCVEGLSGKEEYYPVIEALSQLCSSPDGARACQILARMAPAWLAALSRESTANDGSATGPRNTNQDRMPGDLCAALEELAATRPLILIFEDLHWADDSTIHLISALARRRSPARLMILATSRPQGVAVENPLKSLKQDLLLRRLCIEIALAPLAKNAVKELIARELKQQQQTLPPGLATFVHQHSEGNPLFVIALVEHLIAQQFLVRSGSGGEARWEQHAPFQEMEAGVPDGLAQMIELEIERLTPEEKRLLEAASLMSVAFPAWAVAAALGEDFSDIEEACDDLARRLHFVQRVGQDELPDGTRSGFYVFAHGLYREVLYQRQTATRRARRHTRIAERLGQLFAGREAHVAREMALHYEAAANWQRAAASLRIAAQHALARQAHAEAAELLEHALRIAENLPESERAASALQICSDLQVTRPILSEKVAASAKA